MSLEMEDPIALFDEARKQEADALKTNARFKRLTRSLFTTDTGKQWLRLALARVNFMGSVFNEDMDTHRAAYQDGRRSVFSDILNDAADAVRRPSVAADSDDE